MAYRATVINVFIASPSDVENERKIIREVINNWNYLNSESRKIVLLPVGWETHAAPGMEDKPQNLINRNILEGCDLLVGVFWTRIGTPTEDYVSGSVEEIERHISQGKPAMLYFSSKNTNPDDIDQKQYQSLKTFKEQCFKRGLVEKISSEDEFRKKFSAQLIIKINQNPYLNELLPKEADPDLEINDQEETLEKIAFSEDENNLLLAASEDHSGIVLAIKTIQGIIIKTNEKGFTKGNSPREEAKWIEIIKRFVKYGFLEDEGYKNEYFKMTAKGYKAADQLKENLDVLVEESLVKQREVDVIFSDDEQSLLLAAASDSNGLVHTIKVLGGIIVQSNSIDFLNCGEPREEAKWIAIIDKFIEYDLFIEEGYDGETFRITNKGYEVADQVREIIKRDHSD